MSQIETSQGNITYWDTKPLEGPLYPTVLFIHGHLSHKGFFSRQATSPLLSSYRLLFLDLPGYGESAPPREPEKIYSLPGFAHVVAEMAQLLHLENLVIVGWSLGGHIALELTSILSQLKGILITGTPPIEISSQGFEHGYQALSPDKASLFGKGMLSEEEACLLATLSGYDGTQEKRYIVEAILQTDEGAKILYPLSIFKGIGQNEEKIARTWPHPIAVILGKEDPCINHDYIVHHIPFHHLWKGEVHLIKGGHGAQLDQPVAFNSLLNAFLVDVFKEV